jgi:hypothetical protein
MSYNAVTIKEILETHTKNWMDNAHSDGEWCEQCDDSWPCESLAISRMAKDQHDQVKEALGIIEDLADLHDSYVGYLLAHNMYNEVEAAKIGERINVLKLKQ